MKINQGERTMINVTDAFRKGARVRMADKGSAFYGRDGIVRVCNGTSATVDFGEDTYTGPADMLRAHEEKGAADV